MRRLVYITFLLAFVLSVGAFCLTAPEFSQETSVKCETPVSLRVKAAMDVSLSRDENTEEYGFLITRQRLLLSEGLENDDLKLDCSAFYLKGVSKSTDADNPVDNYFSIEEQTLCYTALIRNIPKQYYDDVLVVRTYIVAGQETQYGDTREVSLYSTAKQIKEDTELFYMLTKEQKNVINDIIYTVEGYPEEFTVTFFAQQEIFDTKTVLDGESIEEIACPSIEGYKFLGWSTVNNGEIIDVKEYTITQNTEFFAVFREKEMFNVSFYCGNKLIDSFVVMEDEKTPLTNKLILAEGVEFAGWSLSKNAVIDDLITEDDRIIIGNMDFYAVIIDNRTQDSELVKMLEKGIEKLKVIRLSNKKHRQTRDVLVECMTLVVEDAKNGLYVDKDYIFVNYEGYLLQIRDLIKVQMTEEERSKFINMLTNEKNVPIDVQDFLMEYFDIAPGDLS